MPMLLDIRDTVADYAELIARVVGVDVEVVDAGLNRLAGTGLYASGVGENIRAEGETYRHVMRIRRSFVMETPREHFICTRCPGRDLCRETLSISTPIIDGSDVLGVIGLVCSTDEDRARVLGHKDVYVQFIERCAEFILHKLHDHADLLRARSFLDIMLRILDHGLKDDLPLPVRLVPGYVQADLAVKSFGRSQDAHVDIAVFFFGNVWDNEGNGTGYPFAQGAGALVKAVAKPGGRVFYHPDLFVTDTAPSVQDV